MGKTAGSPAPRCAEKVQPAMIPPRRSFLFFPRAALLAALGGLTLAAAAGTNGLRRLEPPPLYRQAARLFAAKLPATHLLQLPLDDAISAHAWTNYLAMLDYDRSYFRQEDIDAFLPRREQLDDDVKAGDISFAFEVFARFRERLAERVDHVERLLEEGFDFDVDESYCWKRKDAPWPADVAEQNELWRLRIKNECLAYAIARDHDASNRLQQAAAATNAPASLAATNGPAAQAGEKPPDLTPEDFVRKRYRQFRIVIDDSDAEWVVQRFLGALAAAYDPHTAYMAPSAMEEFNIDMNLSLGGIGAVLEPEDGAAKVKQIIPGGPAARDTRETRLREGDKIIGVGQDNGPVEDVLHLPLTQTVRKIRGKKGTRVVLQVVGPGDDIRLVDLIRDDVRLEEQAATGRVARVAFTGGVVRAFGVIRLPTFYGSMTANPRDPAYRSCTRDVARIITSMSDEIEGLVLDLRGNGGGSLREAVELTGRFIRLGPVVQVREIGRIHVIPDRDPAVTFRKPMVILVNRVSASASEIVAAALQDYGRAVIIGDSRTHGKGTVQTILPLGTDPRLGSLKVTCASYYRVSGGSTQLRGVESDIVIPSTLEHLDIGEDKLPNPIPWNAVPPADYRPVYDMRPLIPQLAGNAAERLAANPRYARHLKTLEHVREISRRTTLPLKRTERLAQFAAEREMRRLLEEEDAEAVEEETEGEEEGEEGEERKDAAPGARPAPAKRDLVLDEALRVLADLCDMQRGTAILPERDLPFEVHEWLRRIFTP
jgi:carboxyl-terminal processing protease